MQNEGVGCVEADTPEPTIADPGCGGNMVEVQTKVKNWIAAGDKKKL